jgi:tetratricopeptide (TPR) repeat protein
MAFIIKGTLGGNLGPMSSKAEPMLIGPSNCPRCKAELNDARNFNGTAICSCGWIDPRAARVHQHQQEIKIIKLMVLVAFIMAGIYAHLLSWGAYATDIPLLKVSQMTGLLSNDGYREIAKACIDLNKYDCAKDAYSELYNEKHDVQALNDLAWLENQLGESTNAIATYKAYFTAGGKDLEAFTQYGFLLETSGQSEEAAKVYENGIANSGNSLPVKATTGLVHLLIKEGKYNEALERINTFHASAGNAEGYLNNEKTQLEEALSKQAKSPNSKSSARKGA